MEAKDIKGLLPRGAIAQVSKELNISITTVSKVANGNYPTPRRNEILNALISHIVKYNANEAQAKQALKDLGATLNKQ
ncbi:MAG: hypothetical protein RRZ64_05440 [Rikenellaceae bacterium]